MAELIENAATAEDSGEEDNQEGMGLDLGDDGVEEEDSDDEEEKKEE